MPRTSISWSVLRWRATVGVRGELALDGGQELRIRGLVDVVRPHHDRVLVDLLVVVLAHADRDEPELAVEVLRSPVGDPHLQGEALRAPRDPLAREPEQQSGA